MQKTKPLSLKTKKIYDYFKSWFVDDFQNLLSKIPNFFTFKAHKNKTADQNLFKPLFI